jgi:hypothetical protein
MVYSHASLFREVLRAVFQGVKERACGVKLAEQIYLRVKLHLKISPFLSLERLLLAGGFNQCG